MSLVGKVVIVTGASSGIGATTTEAFAKQGFKVVLVGRNEANLKATEAACKAINSKAELLSITIDVTMPSAFTRDNIVNVSSVSALRSLQDASSYCTSEAALDQFTRCIALDLGPKNVRVNSVNPGVIETDILRNAGLSPEQLHGAFESCKETHPLGRVGGPKDKNYLNTTF